MGEAREVIPCAMGLIFAFFVARVPEVRTKGVIIGIASFVLGFVATLINGETMAHVLFDAPQVAFASVVGIMFLQRYKPEWIGLESAEARSTSTRR